MSPFQFVHYRTTWTDVLSNPSLRNEKVATKRLRKLKYLKKNMSQYHFSVTDFTRTNLLPNPGLRSENFGTNCLSHCTAVIWKRTLEGFTEKMKI